MRLSELIKQLKEIETKHGGDLKVTAEFSDEFSPMRSITVVDKLGCDIKYYQSKAYGVHID